MIVTNVFSLFCILDVLSWVVGEFSVILELSVISRTLCECIDSSFSTYGSSARINNRAILHGLRPLLIFFHDFNKIVSPKLTVGNLWVTTQSLGHEGFSVGREIVSEIAGKKILTIFFSRGQQHKGKIKNNTQNKRITVCFGILSLLEFICCALKSLYKLLLAEFTSLFKITWHFQVIIFWGGREGGCRTSWVVNEFTWLWQTLDDVYTHRCFSESERTRFGAPGQKALPSMNEFTLL